jgi:prephenate dehydrogenase
MPHWKRVTIIGVGLIGGSIGLALRKRGLADEVVGYSRRAETLTKAREIGAIDTACDTIAAAANGAQLVIACAPVRWIPDHLHEAARHCCEGALLTDVGSTKQAIVAALGDLPDRVRFCAAHPLAGSEKSGPQFADEQLFERRVVVITPTPATPSEAVAETSQLWRSFGAETVQRDPAGHDRALAATSHLPHVIASMLAAATSPADLPLTATGWRDTTRVAGGDVELWRQILVENSDNVVQTLEHFETLLKRFRDALVRDDQAAIVQLLAQGKANRDALGS